MTESPETPSEIAADDAVAPVRAGEGVVDADRDSGSGRRFRSWDQMTTAEKRAVVAAGIVQVGLMAAAQTDLLRRSADQVRGPKPAWFAANFVNFAGPISYFVFGRRR